MEFNCFICPLCGQALTDTGSSLRCTAGHSFDKARQGYAHLLPVQQKHALLPGDDREMVAARRRFLAGGWYDPFCQKLCELSASALNETENPLIADAGCGEGYYTAAVKDALLEAGVLPRICAFDISKFAVKAAAGQHKGIDFAVASSYAIPLSDACVDLVLNIFSPMADREFARILKPGGTLIFAVPSARHLWGLKEILYEKPYENEEKEIEYPGFSEIDRVPVRAQLSLSAQAACDLFAMTPYAWKTGSAGRARLQALDHLETEIGFDFLVFRRENTPAGERSDTV